MEFKNYNKYGLKGYKKYHKYTRRGGQYPLLSKLLWCGQVKELPDLFWVIFIVILCLFDNLTLNLEENVLVIAAHKRIHKVDKL